MNFVGVFPEFVNVGKGELAKKTNWTNTGKILRCSISLNHHSTVH